MFLTAYAMDIMSLVQTLGIYHWKFRSTLYLSAHSTIDRCEQSWKPSTLQREICVLMCTFLIIFDKSFIRVLTTTWSLMDRPPAPQVTLEELAPSTTVLGSSWQMKWSGKSQWNESKSPNGIIQKAKVRSKWNYDKCLNLIEIIQVSKWNYCKLMELFKKLKWSLNQIITSV